MDYPSFLTGWLATALAFGLAIAMYNSGEAEKLKRRAIAEGVAEYNPQNGKARWLDAKVCRVVLGDSHEPHR